ncbi:MAG TPA: type II CAAX endopeptidase family protein [Caulobacter sp.]|nr:type II CAAX endopeptidase family protein [Caulobacter sp.]
MSRMDVSPLAPGLDIGSRRVLHLGPLRWLRALGWGGLLFVIFMVFYAVVSQAGEPALGAAATPLSLVVVAVLSAVGLGLYAGIARLAEGRWPSELGLGQAASELLIGLLVGAAMLSAVVAALLVFGLYDISGPRASSPLAMINVGVASGVFEELIFRAIVLRLLMRAFGAWPALALSAALFGALHLSNPNATPVAAIAIAVEAGLMLASFYLLTGRLWVSIGVHAAWNFTQGWIWGARVSGIPVRESLYLSAPKPGAPDWLSGGAFGPEASVPAMLIGTGVAVMVLHQAWKKGHFQVRSEPIPPVAEVFD